MCGIAGKINFDGPVDPLVIRRMCRAMRHRGPSSRGEFARDGVAIGMQRLAIIDVVGGDQPVFNEDGSVVVVMNGEIYNYQELRSELITRGHVFSTHSDTEVLVHLYEDLGDRMVERLRGMFAFAIWDARQRELLLGRDRVGKKPLFWARDGSTIWFCSELYALMQDHELRRSPDARAIASYLTFQYVPAPMCVFADVRKVVPATTLRVNDRGVTERQYWSLSYEPKLDGVPEQELQERLRDLLWESTRLRLMSEVPLGAFLSGGVDSSAVVAAMADQMGEPVKTFSIGFGDDTDFDELHFARIVAERCATDHHEFHVRPEAIAILPRMARHYGEPFADSSAIPSFYLAELTGRHVTVALNGDGGDESFAGYERYFGSRVPGLFDWVPLPVRRLAPGVTSVLGDGPRVNSHRTRLQRLARAVAMDPAERYAHWMSIFPATMSTQAFTSDFAVALDGWRADRLLVERLLASSATRTIDVLLDVDVHTYLPGDLLVKMDIATMAHSVEARSPFLDHHLMEFAAALPVELKLRGKQSKRILKAALRGVVPDAILDRSKMGFGVPLARWFREDLRELPGEVLLDPASHTLGYIRRDAVERIIRDHQEGRADHAMRLWALLAFEFWYREVAEAPLMQLTRDESLAPGTGSDARDAANRRESRLSP
jgi:asparagine synthase (glutamine-hydrolysing)